MTGSIALDVLIGLVSVYLLYSLLITILGEMVANWLGIRARILRLSVERMLNDGYQEGTHNVLGDFFLHEYDEFGYSTAGRIYNSSLKYLSKGKRKWWLLFRPGKPSYISADYFADSFIHLFREKGEGADDIEKISFSLKYNTLHIQPETKALIENMLIDSGKDIDAFKKKVMKWFDETQDRANGWYKRKLQFILFWLGFVVAVAFNVDTIDIARKLANDEKARAQMVSIGIASGDTTGSIYQALKDTASVESYKNVKKSVDEANHVLGLGWTFPTNAGLETWEFTTNAIDAVRERITAYDTELKELRAKMQYVKNEKEKKQIKLEIDLLPKKKSNFIRLIANIQWKFVQVEATFEEKSITFTGRTAYTNWEKILFILKSLWGWKIIGISITALLLSLGAPFWFDLLRKLVSIRSAGVKPEEKPAPKQEPEVKKPKLPPPPPPPAVKSPLENAVDSAALLVKGMVDVTVRRGFVKVAGKQMEGLEVIAYSPSSGTATQKILGALYNGFPVVVFVTTPVTTFQAIAGTTINVNPSINGTGTLGCFVKGSNPNDRFLLSCWHVIKGSKDMYDASEVEWVSDKSNKVIARVVDGTITDKMDVGFAKMTDPLSISNLNIGIKFNCRKISTLDAQVRTQVSFWGQGVLRTGLIYNDTLSQLIPYPAGKHQIDDLFSITKFVNGKCVGPGHQGDSGAIVVDAAGYPVGIVVGGDGAFTYAVKLSNVLSPTSIYKNYKILLK